MDLIVTYENYIRQQNRISDIIKKDVRLNFIKIIDPDTVWFGIGEVPCFNLQEVENGNIEYIHKSSARVSRLFNHI